jgi:hypothetical protein
LKPPVLAVECGGGSLCELFDGRRTPLDAITWLEQRSPIATVVLAGTYARNDHIAIFLAEFYPAIRLEQEI